MEARLSNEACGLKSIRGLSVCVSVLEFCQYNVLEGRVGVIARCLLVE